MQKKCQNYKQLGSWSFFDKSCSSCTNFWHIHSTAVFFILVSPLLFSSFHGAGVLWAQQHHHAAVAHDSSSFEHSLRNSSTAAPYIFLRRRSLLMSDGEDSSTDSSSTDSSDSSDTNIEEMFDGTSGCGKFEPTEVDPGPRKQVCPGPEKPETEPTCYCKMSGTCEGVPGCDPKMETPPPAAVETPDPEDPKMTDFCKKVGTGNKCNECCTGYEMQDIYCTECPPTPVEAILATLPQILIGIVFFLLVKKVFNGIVTVEEGKLDINGAKLEVMLRYIQSIALLTFNFPSGWSPLFINTFSIFGSIIFIDPFLLFKSLMCGWGPSLFYYRWWFMNVMGYTIVYSYFMSKGSKPIIKKFGKTAFKDKAPGIMKMTVAVTYFMGNTLGPNWFFGIIKPFDCNRNLANCDADDRIDGLGGEATFLYPGIENCFPWPNPVLWLDLLGGGYTNLLVTLLMLSMLGTWFSFAIMPFFKIWRFKHLMNHKLPLAGTTVEIELDKALEVDMKKGQKVTVNGIECVTLCDFRGPVDPTKENLKKQKYWPSKDGEGMDEWEGVGDYADGGMFCFPFCCFCGSPFDKMCCMRKKGDKKISLRMCTGDNEEEFQQGTSVLVAQKKGDVKRGIITRIAPDDDDEKIEVRWDSPAESSAGSKGSKGSNAAAAGEGEGGGVEIVDAKDVTRMPFSFFIKSKDKLEIVGQELTLSIKKAKPVSSYIPDLCVYMQDKRNRRAIKKKDKKTGEISIETNCCKTFFLGFVRDAQYSDAAHPALYYKYHQFYRQDCILWYYVKYLRVLLLGCVGMFLTHSAIFAGILIFFILLVSLALQLWYNPYKSEYTDDEEGSEATQTGDEDEIEEEEEEEEEEKTIEGEVTAAAKEKLNEALGKGAKKAYDKIWKKLEADSGMKDFNEQSPKAFVFRLKRTCKYLVLKRFIDELQNVGKTAVAGLVGDDNAEDIGENWAPEPQDPNLDEATSILNTILMMVFAMFVGVMPTAIGVIQLFLVLVQTVTVFGEQLKIKWLMSKVCCCCPCCKAAKNKSNKKGATKVVPKTRQAGEMKKSDMEVEL